MSRSISRTSPADVAELWREIEPRIAASGSVEDAAQQLATALHDRFEPSVVLARVFLTVPYGALPAPVQAIARALAARAVAPEDLAADTPVLALMGTRGEKDEWCDREASESHAGIPLIDPSFVAGIPMVAALLGDLGLPLSWGEGRRSDLVHESRGRGEGIFFVPDAATATDARGRKVIPAQKFVSEHGVRGVWGVGGAYPSHQLLVLIAFCRDRLPRETAERFLPLASRFQAGTRELVAAGRLFRPGP